MIDKFINNSLDSIKNILGDALVEGYNKYPNDFDKRKRYTKKVSSKLFMKFYDSIPPLWKENKSGK